MLRLISRILIGLLFIFSGFIKAVDPVGGSIKFTDYFEAFGMDFLTGFALPLAIILSTIEFMIGFHLLVGIRLKQTSVAAFYLMVFFTSLTLILAIFNPVTDCGCFGDAIKLTNWETFFKNLISLPFTLILFRDRNNSTEPVSYTRVNLLTLVSVIFGVGISVHSYRHLPMIDFRPFKAGVNIPDGMKIPEGAPQAQYNTTFILEKNGTRKEFDENNYPYDDTSWVFIDSKSVLIKEGYQPPIKDFYITDKNGNDQSEQLLNSKKPVFLMIAPDLKKVRPGQISRLKAINKACHKKNIKFYCVTSSLYEDILRFVMKSRSAMKYLFADEVFLQTLIRANPGLVVVKDGTILAKYNYPDVPGPEIVNDPVSYVISHNSKQTERMYVDITGLFLILSIILIYKK